MVKCSEEQTHGGRPSNSTLESWRSCVLDELFGNIGGQLWRVDTLLLVNAILAGVIVGIGTYGHRYRHYGFTRYLLLRATTLFPPIISYVLSAIGSTSGSFDVSIIGKIYGECVAQCHARFLHPYLVIVSTCLVLISVINTSPIVATDDREDRSIRPPFELLLQGIWTGYLITNTNAVHVVSRLDYLRYTPFALLYAKMALKCYAFLKARRSFALGHNPRLIVGYMQHLREGGGMHGEPRIGEEDVPPALVVMGEDKHQVEKQPHGYMFSKNLEAIEDGGLVTIDKVWQLSNRLLKPMPQLKDVCLSYALFKLLRCRFARYQLNDISTGTLKSLRSFLLKNGEHERTFKMIADDLSFLHDYYDSPLPVSSSDCWSPILSMVISLVTIGYCRLSGMDIAVMYIKEVMYRKDFEPPEMFTVRCSYYCRETPDTFLGTTTDQSGDDQYFGNMYFDIVPALLLFVFVVIAEARDIASHICSSLTKVTLTCYCVRRASLKLSPIIPKWVGCLLQCRCKLTNRHWNDKMRQSSILVLRPSQFQLMFPRSLFHFLGHKGKNVKVPTTVKVCIINALRSSCNNGGLLSKGTTSLRQSQVGESLLWACNSKGTSDTILVWHIATSILQVKYPHHQHDDLPQPQGHRGSSVPDYKTAATHLSRYCAYLVAFCPELLPDDDAWSKGLYKDVKKDAVRALARGIRVSTPEAEYQELVDKLQSTESKHEVLKDAAKLGKQLVELTEGEEVVWELLAGFWSEMIIYLAPSDNIKGHGEAIDRGGELITLLWALLTHVGIVDRPNDTPAAAASAPGRV